MRVLLRASGMGQGQNAENATSRGWPKEERRPPRKLRRGNQEVSQMGVGATETKMS